MHGHLQFNFLLRIDDNSFVTRVSMGIGDHTYR